MKPRESAARGCELNAYVMLSQSILNDVYHCGFVDLYA